MYCRQGTNGEKREEDFGDEGKEKGRGEKGTVGKRGNEDQHEDGELGGGERGGDGGGEDREC